MKERRNITLIYRSCKFNRKSYTRISVCRIIINNVYPDNASCNFCTYKSKAQSGYLAEIKNHFQGKEIKIIPAQPQEVKGLVMLSLITKYL
ncbi:MAG: ArsA-related P-loop ATPase [Bacillota bacterium]